MIVHLNEAGPEGVFVEPLRFYSLKLWALEFNLQLKSED